MKRKEITSPVCDEEASFYVNKIMDGVKNITLFNIQPASVLYPHVDKIDAIDIIIMIRFDKCNRLYYDVECRSVRCAEDDAYYRLFQSVTKKITDKLTEDDIRGIILDINTHANILKFHKRLGRFFTYTPPKEDANNVSGEICPICFDLTKNITSCCDKGLCIPCFQQLRLKCVCPLCRETEINLQQI